MKRKLLIYVLGKDFFYLTTTLKIPKLDGIQVQGSNVTILSNLYRLVCSHLVMHINDIINAQIKQ